jgi:hypothetical protein
MLVPRAYASARNQIARTVAGRTIACRASRTGAPAGEQARHGKRSAGVERLAA